jgi:hypothetical protein
VLIRLAKIQEIVRTLFTDTETAIKEVQAATDHVYKLATFDYMVRQKKDERMMAQLPGVDTPSFSDYPSIPAITHFEGRGVELKKMLDHFTGPQEGSVRKVAVISGLGGVGKTSLGIQFGSQCQGSGLFNMVLKVDCANEESVRRCCSEFVQEYALPGSQGAASDENMLQVKNWLSKLGK